MRNNPRTSALLASGFFIVAAIVLGSASLGSPAPNPPLPPLLKDVTAGGGWWGACPPETEEEAHERQGRPIATSPELDQRLAQLFPTGSNERMLVETLRGQGFELLPSCKSDHSIRVAAFEQHGESVSSYPIIAHIFWKVDNSGKIVWTKGFVRYVGL
jgi:hypothetical protein